MNRKNLISLTIAFAFLALATTGILLFIKQKAHAVEITHTLFGLLFIGFAIFHILNNWSSIKAYSKERRSGKWTKEVAVAAGIFGLLLVGGATEILEPVAEFGRNFAPKRKPRADQQSYEIVKAKGDGNNELSIFIEKANDQEQSIIIISDAAGNTIFAPQKSVAPTEKEPLERQIAEDEALITDLDANTLGTSKPNFDGFTPLGNFVIKTQAMPDTLTLNFNAPKSLMKALGTGKVVKGKGFQSIILNKGNGVLEKAFVEY